MTHHSAFWTSSRIERLRLRNGSAFSPIARDAAPRATPKKTIWRTLSSENAVTMFVGMMPVRKSTQPPTFSGASAFAVLRVTP